MTPKEMPGPQTPNSGIEEDDTEGSEILVVGDLNGSMEAFTKNLICLGILPDTAQEDSTPTLPRNSSVVFLGDILADRDADGLKIIRKILEMREQFIRVGTLWGNHETFAAALVLSELEIVRVKYAGMLEVLKLHPDAEDIFDASVLNARINANGMLEVSDNHWRTALNTFKTPEIRAAALATEGGQALSQYLISSKLYHQNGDTLYFHTPPTAAMLSFALQAGNELNCAFSRYTKTLLERPEDKKNSQISKHQWKKYADIFLYTYTRLHSSVPDANDRVWAMCSEYHIKRIIFGHDRQRKPVCLKRGPVDLYPVDMGFHGVETPEKRYRSAARVNRNGVWVSGEKVA